MQSGPVYGHVGNRSPENAAKSRAGLESLYVPLQSSDCFRRTQRRRGSPQPSPRPRHDPAQTSHPRPLTGAEPVVPGIPEVFWRDAEAGERNLEGVISVAQMGPTNAEVATKSRARTGCASNSRKGILQQTSSLIPDGRT